MKSASLRRITLAAWSHRVILSKNLFKMTKLCQCTIEFRYWKPLKPWKLKIGLNSKNWVPKDSPGQSSSKNRTSCYNKRQRSAKKMVQKITVTTTGVILTNIKLMKVWWWVRGIDRGFRWSRLFQISILKTSKLSLATRAVSHIAERYMEETESKSLIITTLRKVNV